VDQATGWPEWWDRPYEAGRSKHWVKVKNRKHPAMSRVMEISQARGRALRARDQ